MLTRWCDLRDELSRIGSGATRVPVRSELSDGQLPPDATRWPTADVFESGTRLLLAVDLPGCKREAIEVALQGEVLTVRARIDEPAAEGAAWQRSFTLPFGIDMANVTASWADGVLSVQLPKTGHIAARIPIPAEA